LRIFKAVLLFKLKDTNLIMDISNSKPNENRADLPYKVALDVELIRQIVTGLGLSHD